jgi:predicted nucleic acid-binding protein
MKVADSSFLIEALLRDASLLENENFIAPDLALYEVVNTLWRDRFCEKEKGSSESLVESRKVSLS